MKSTITIRAVEKRDNAILAKIIRGVFIEHNAPQEGTVYTDPTTDDLYQLFQVQKSELWVGELDGEIMGCCGIHPTEGLDGDCTELVKFYLHKSGRGKGIGRALMQQCVDSALRLGYEKIYLESLPHFAKAVNMYLKQGFTELDKPLGCSGHTTCNIWMVKSLV